MAHNPSPFADLSARPLDAAKFRDPLVTAKGERRASVALRALETLWLNTGTLCNLACTSCYIASSPRNDALVYLSLAEAVAYLEEAAALGTREIGFTGGEPFMNPDMVPMIAAALARGFDVLVLTNAMRPMRRFEAALAPLAGPKLTMRVSLDHHSQSVHEAERGAGTWAKAVDGLRWLSEAGFRVAVAGRQLPGETEAEARAGYQRLFEALGITVDAGLVLFPPMDAAADVPEITEACWDILHLSPDAMMCASSRMVVKPRGADRPHVVACTLLPYDPQFALGETLADASGKVMLNHPHCAKFCVLGGASCSG
ncbi:radical SAM protein [Sphingomonas deserti]|uniref:Radical SAM protein n=1 Tax=Allosphingosinicella deserti TaxID=2116704 RepID=A0A2P7QSN7_9SPHN|nr:radical SAM protein [Sphingomonas deserti]PSJ40976.1 radical SAM protein [Sphingomonas deserti]